MRQPIFIGIALVIGIILATLAWMTPFTRGDETEPPAHLGRQIEEFTLQDFRGREWALTDFEDADVLVVAFLGTECPLVQLYAARLNEMAESFAEHGVRMVGIFSNRQDSITEMAAFARRQEIVFPLLKDAGNDIADQFGAERTPEVFVLDAERVIRYRGCIDDQYSYGLQRPAVDNHYLQDALEALLDDRNIIVAATEPVGCHIGRALTPQTDSEVTYSNQISRLLQQQCVRCHRPGEIAPFALTEYDEVVGWAAMIEEVVREQRMPPWHANPEHGQFSNDARLSEEEKQLLYDWVAAGAPEGDRAELPEPLTYIEGWQIGEPDLIVYMDDDAFQVPAEGVVDYQYFVVDPGFTEDTWIRAAECRPGNRSVVHHIIVAAGGEQTRNRVHGNLDSEWLVASAPGALPLELPQGMAKLVPAGAKLIFQMHYTPNGRPQEDRSCVGLIFADPNEVRQQVFTQEAHNHRFRIPPGARNHRVESNYTVEQDSLLLAMFPHMHLRGKSFRYTAIFPDGREEILLDVPRYDFNWQNAYVPTEPVRMPAGTRLHCVAHFDNSERNLANPDPNATVQWGDQTWEEMMIGYFDIVIADQDLTQPPPASRAGRFMELLALGEIEFSDELRELAATSLASQDALQCFAAALRDQTPQVDRICWITGDIEEEQIRIELVAQTRRYGPITARGDITLPAQGFALLEYTSASEPFVHRQLNTVESPDMQLMARGFGSSVHYPREIAGKPGIISFWSTDGEAFPPAAVELLGEVVGQMDIGD